METLVGWRRHVRPAVAALEPYAWEMSSREVSERYGVPLERIVRFDTNTSPFAPTNLSTTLRELAERMPLNEYPDTAYGELVDAIRAYSGFPAEGIVVGCGADELLDMIAKVFVETGSRAVVTGPTYGMYAVLTETYAGHVRPVPDRPGFERDFEGIADAAGEAALVWLCNPNNPTANLIPAAGLERLAASVSCPLVVDEAYFEFCGVTAADLIARHPQVIVVRTLSKAFSLAGLRVGYALAAPEMAAALNRVRPPNSVGALSVALGTAALRDATTMRRRVDLILREKARFAELLRRHVTEVYPSATNFLLIRVDDPGRVVEALLRQGLVVRDVSAKRGLQGCLRPTVRLPEENDRFVAALASI
ncbi:MAG TPA: histidinol-phosphate transaminase [Chloroflexota bacterium]